MSGMKASTIKRLLKDRIDDWLKTVDDENVLKLIKRDVLVSGGCIASAFAGDKINDYDYYFRTRETALAVAHYYVKRFNALNPPYSREGIQYEPHIREMEVVNCKGVSENRIIIYMKSAGVAGEGQQEYQYYEMRGEAEQEAFFESLGSEKIASAVSEDPMEAGEALVQVVRAKEKYRPIFLSENAITLNDKVQLVVRFYGEASELHENYDYAHAMCWFDYAKYELHAPAEALEAILTKTLIYKGSLYPIASIFRLRKFIERGWRITAGQLLKIIFQISKLNLEDRHTLREQLIGVDQAYMTQLLSAISENKSQRLDSVYIAKLIDEIFE